MLFPLQLFVYSWVTLLGCVYLVLKDQVPNSKDLKLNIPGLDIDFTEKMETAFAEEKTLAQNQSNLSFPMINNDGSISFCSHYTC